MYMFVFYKLIILKKQKSMHFFTLLPKLYLFYTIALLFLGLGKVPEKKKKQQKCSNSRNATNSAKEGVNTKPLMGGAVYLSVTTVTDF